MTENITRRQVIKATGSGALGVAVGSQAAGAQPDRDRHIVGVEPGRADVARDRADEVYRVLDFGDIGQAVAGWYPEEALDGLRNNPNVRYIERDGEMHALEQTLPWGIDRVDADVAHDEGETGAGADIAVIDTGIDSDHYDLEANLGTGKAYVNCGDCSCFPPGSCGNDNECHENWDDDNDHGTHCAGIADAIDNSEGVIGVSTEATLHAVKVLDCGGGGAYSDIAAGIEWTADQGYDVGSLSLGGDDSETVQDACQYAYEEGVLLVAAAGNDGPCSDCVGYPAAYDEVIAVSATSEDDSLADFSSTGPEVELAAPGEDILSTVPPESSSDGLDTFSGTSMACPHVSGAGAQLMANGDTNTEARDQLNSTAEDIGLGDNEQGNGLVDMAAALGLDDSDGDDNTAPSVDDLSASEVETDNEDAEFEVDWQVSDSDGNLDSVDLTLTDDTDGETEDTASTSVSGDTASGTTRLVAAGDDGSGNDYTVELVVTDSEGASDSDMTTVSETEDDGGETAPAVDSVNARDESRGGRPHANIAVDWEVSDEDGDLDTVVTELYDSDGSRVDDATTDVSGGSASDTDNFEVKHGRGEDYEAVVTVTDGGDREDTSSDIVQT